MHNECIKISRAAWRQDYVEIKVILIKENALNENKSFQSRGNNSINSSISDK